MIIGVTGRIATGKTTLAHILEDRGFLRIDADTIYHSLRRSSKKMNSEIFEYFGTLDNTKILNTVGDNPSSLSKLNKITHKYVVSDIKKIINSNRRANIVLDVPVPVKIGFLDIVNFIIVTDCSEKEQIKRIRARDKISTKAALKKIYLQKNRDFYCHLGNYIINTEDMDVKDLIILADTVISSTKF